MNEEKISVTNDLVFQQIFGKVGNERITKGFLEKILGIKIDNLTLDVNKRMQGNRIDDKIGRLDVKARLENGTIVIVEMQVAGYKEIAERLLYYWSKAYTEDLRRGEDYFNLKKTIAILISVENLEQTEGIERYHTIWQIREKEEKEKIFTDDLEIHVIELGKFKEGMQGKNPEDDWIRFIKAGGKEDMEKITSEEVDKVVAEAIEEFNNLVDDPEHHEEYLWREKELRDKISFISSAKRSGIAEGIEKGIKKGKEEGENNKAKSIAKKMLEKKIDIKTISELTGLTENEIRNIM